MPADPGPTDCNDSTATTIVFATTGGATLMLHPGTADAALDDCLAQAGAASVVIIPLVKPPSRWSFRVPSETAQRAKLPAEQWQQATVTDGAVTLPAVRAFDMRRQQARTIAKKLGVQTFYWGARAAPLEAHPVAFADDDEGYEWQQVKARAMQGADDLGLALQSLDAARAADAVPRPVLLLGVGALCAAFGMTLFFAVASVPTLVGPLAIITDPAFAPTMIAALWLRFALRSTQRVDVDPTTAESEQAWRQRSGQLAALWLFCGMGVVLLALAQMGSHPPENVADFIETTGTRLLICLWLLVPLSTARRFEDAIACAIEAVVTIIVAIFVLKLTLFITDMFMGFFWDILASVLPMPLPPLLIAIADAVVNTIAELFFLAVMLGYTWSRTREHLVRGDVPL